MKAINLIDGNRRLSDEGIAALDPDGLHVLSKIMNHRYTGDVRCYGYFKVGERAVKQTLVDKAFEEEAGHFWGILETRPYMRARQGLALCLWELGERREAMEHYTRMLSLNPGDNQGIRYLLAPALLEEGYEQGLEELLTPTRTTPERPGSPPGCYGGLAPRGRAREPAPP